MVAFTGQAGAIRHGIARALLKADEELRPNPEKGWSLNKRSKNEGKKEIRPQKSKKSTTVLKEIILCFITHEFVYNYKVCLSQVANRQGV